MSIDLSPISPVQRLLFAIPLVPIQGHRFQPTGFPNLGAATFQTQDGTSLLVESPQSLANRLELMVWDEVRQDVRSEFLGLSHVRVTRQASFLTDTILESHRMNSPYLLENPDRAFFSALQSDLGALAIGPIDRKKLATTLLNYDVGSLLHGVFLAKKDLAGGRLRVTRSMTAFIEADGVRNASSGGVKNDHVNPSGDTKAGFGNVPFARDEFTAEKITLYVNIDLVQIRGYGLGADVERLLILSALYKLRALLSHNLRLRTACDLRVAAEVVSADQPAGFVLPELTRLSDDLKASIGTCKDLMQVREIEYKAELKKAKDAGKKAQSDSEDDETEDGDTEE